MLGRIRPVKFDWGIEFDPPLKLGGNHWNDTQFDLAEYKCNLSEFTPIFTSISCPVEFEIRPGMKYCSKWE